MEDKPLLLSLSEITITELPSSCVVHKYIYTKSSTLTTTSTIFTSNTASSRLSRSAMIQIIVTLYNCHFNHEVILHAHTQSF